MGKERVRVWPRARGKAKTAEAKKLQDDFRQASWACKYWDPRNIISVDQMRKGTPVLIRDLQIMMMYNRFAHFFTTDGRPIYSMQARQDVSDSLDSISPLPGSLLYRTVDGWRYIAPPTDQNLALVTDATHAPVWTPQSSATGTVNKASIEAHDSIAQTAAQDNIFCPKSGAAAVSNVPTNANNMVLSFTTVAAGPVLITFTARWTKAAGRFRFNIQDTAGNHLWPLNAAGNYYDTPSVEANIFQVSFTATLQMAAGAHNLIVQSQNSLALGAVSWLDRSISALF